MKISEFMKLSELMFKVVSTGKGMLKPGVVVGNIEANSELSASKKIAKQLQGRGLDKNGELIWDLMLMEAIQEIRYAGWLIKYNDEPKDEKYHAIAFLTVKNKVVDSIELMLNDIKVQIKKRSHTVAKDTRRSSKYQTAKRNWDIYAGMTIDFNKAASHLIGMEPTAARITNDGEESFILDIMHPEIYKEFEGDVASLNFKNIKNRLANSPYLGMNTSPKVIHVLGLELGGRYIMDEIGSDQPDLYQRFDLTLHSIQQGKEKVHISDPAFTIAVTPGNEMNRGSQS
jgi:hypothetical protein